MNVFLSHFGPLCVSVFYFVTMSRFGSLNCICGLVDIPLEALWKDILSRSIIMREIDHRVRGGNYSICVSETAHFLHNNSLELNGCVLFSVESEFY